MLNCKPCLHCASALPYRAAAFGMSSQHGLYSNCCPQTHVMLAGTIRGCIVSVVCLHPTASSSHLPRTVRAGFHTFDYARHFLSCASRMLGLEHETLRGAISIEYYGRTVGIKIMPTGAMCSW
jgi:MFS superfamily sulfate permease-like transporter